MKEERPLPSEYHFQKSVVQWLRNPGIVLPQVAHRDVFGVPMGLLNRIRNTHAQQLGASRGMSDIIFSVQGRSLYIELKFGSGQTSQDQVDAARWRKMCGFTTIVLWNNGQNQVFSSYQSEEKVRGGTPLTYDKIPPSLSRKVLIQCVETWYSKMVEPGLVQTPSYGEQNV